MLLAAFDNGAKLNQVVYWSRPVNWKNQDAHAESGHDLHSTCSRHVEGPVVVEIPPADADHVIVGSFDVAWAERARGRRPGRCGQGKGRQVSHHAAGV
jgi:hypothetical protein